MRRRKKIRKRIIGITIEKQLSQMILRCIRLRNLDLHIRQLELKEI